jgi:hypothetical protein
MESFISLPSLAEIYSLDFIFIFANNVHICKIGFREIRNALAPMSIFTARPASFMFVLMKPLRSGGAGRFRAIMN